MKEDARQIKEILEKVEAELSAFLKEVEEGKVEVKD